MVLQRLAADPEVILNLVCPEDAPKSKDGRSREEETLEIVQRAVRGMLNAEDARLVPTSPRRVARTVDVIVVACQKFGLTVSEKKTVAMHLWSDSSTVSNALQIEAVGLTVLCTIVVLSAKARTSTPRLRVALVSLGRVSEDAVLSRTTDGKLSFCSRSWKLCCIDVASGLCAPMILTVCEPHTRSYSMAIHVARVWINRVRLPILHVVS